MDRDNFEDGIFIEDRDGQAVVHNLDNVSFRVQINNLSEKHHSYYEKIKNELLAYDNVISRIYVAKECFYIGTDTVAKFNLVDNELYLYIKINPADNGREVLFRMPNHIVNDNNVSTLLIVNSEKVCKHAIDLIHLLMNKYNI